MSDPLEMAHILTLKSKKCISEEDNILRNFFESLDNPDRVLEAHDLEGGVYKEIEASRLVARSSKSIRKRVFDLRRKTKNKN